MLDAKLRRPLGGLGSNAIGLGSADTRNHKTGLHSSRYGRILTSLLGTPAFPWTAATAFTMRDANAIDLRYINHFLATNRAQSVADEIGVRRRYVGLPWVNILAADRSGHTLYADVGSIPHDTVAQAQACNTPLGAALFASMRLPVLDGSRSSCRART